MRQRVKISFLPILFALVQFNRCSSFSTQSVIPSGHELQTLAEESIMKERGSKSYLKAWRKWTSKCVDRIRHELSKNLPYPENDDEFQTLWHNLGVAADIGEMPSFSNAGSRSGYAINFFCRALLLADLLHDRDSLPSFMSGSFEQTIFDSAQTNENNTGTLNEKKKLKMASIGGGPGYDFVSTVLVAVFDSAVSSGWKGISIDATVFDYEEGWSDLVDAMSLSTQLTFPENEHKCGWGGRCDITVPLSYRVNSSCQKVANSIDMWICQYCVAENAQKLRRRDYVFFSDLFKIAKDGSLFIFTETTPRLWPDLVDIASELEEISFEIAFVRVSGRGNPAPQMVMRKTTSPHKTGLDGSDYKMLHQFRSINEMHERRIKNGFVRQTKKRRGEKS